MNREDFIWIVGNIAMNNEGIFHVEGDKIIPLIRIDEDDIVIPKIFPDTIEEYEEKLIQAFEAGLKYRHTSNHSRNLTKSEILEELHYKLSDEEFFKRWGISRKGE